MRGDSKSLTFVYDGWEGYQQSLSLACKDLTQVQLSFRGHQDMKSVGELFLHIADGRVDWFCRMGVPDAASMWEAINTRRQPPILGGELAAWLDETWQLIWNAISQWTVDDLSWTFEQPYQGKTYAVSRQWVIWRIMAHDIQHGGQVSELLAMQNIFPVELTLLGGHLTEPEVVR